MKVWAKDRAADATVLGVGIEEMSNSSVARTSVKLSWRGVQVEFLKVVLCEAS